MVKDLKNVGMLPAQIHCIFNYLSILELSEDYCSKPSAVTNVNLLACRKCKGAKIRYWLHQYACPCRQFPEEAKDASVSECTWTLSALEALRNALYKFKSYLLTYLLTYLSCHVWTTVTLVLLDHQHTLLLTSCTVYWTLQHVLSLAHASSTTACHTCCTKSCIGSTSQKASTVSSCCHHSHQSHFTYNGRLIGSCV